MGRNKDWRIKEDCNSQNLSTVNAGIQTQSDTSKLANPVVLSPKSFEKLLKPISQIHEQLDTEKTIDAFKDKNLERIEQLLDVSMN